MLGPVPMPASVAANQGRKQKRGILCKQHASPSTTHPVYIADVEDPLESLYTQWLQLTLDAVVQGAQRVDDGLEGVMKHIFF
jgi:hypothetical protein